MNDQEKNTDGLIKASLRMINISLMVIAFAFAYLIKSQFPPSFIAKHFGASEDQEHVVTNDTYIPPFELDASEVKNNIHIPTGLIVDKGVQDVMVTCQSCHSLDIVMQNRADRQGWKDLIVWMQETQNLWDLPNEGIILDYLSKNYAPKNTGRRKNLEDLEWYPYN